MCRRSGTVGNIRTQIGGFGVIAVARSRIELVEEAIQRLRDALGYIDRDRLIVAPDCGLGMLTSDLGKAKLKVMCAAAAAV